MVSFLPFNFIASSTEETIECGKRLAACLEKGDVVSLRGPIGAGKTYFTKGIVAGLGVEDEVTSPTYTIVHEYAGETPVYHIDAYRLRGDDDFVALGGEEFFGGDGVVVIEWSERIPNSIPRGAVVIEIKILEDGKRRIMSLSPDNF
ncbi:MAG: tRNA (adenosine(37)-N6)-threonylcarbamoyltransferase complex ATPase subunit type 1 TsaE [Treponema sp.]|jgi:tRNA threonylcarbamoyladenosine biosynthesis protein TsaE|nr:tRNA (adenosine(37)-N6)-threonylcarbamoyltransferase complex ATPase subunit type 1 TsaE [Treponema sp.]